MADQPRFKRVDHLGIAVPSLDDAVKNYEALLGAQCEGIEEVADQKVRAAFFSVGDTHIELLEPTIDDSPIRGFLEKRRGGLHHICIEVDDIDATLAAYRELGVRLIDEQPRIGAGGKRVAFVHPSATSGVLLEIAEAKPPKPSDED